ncbi:hypothetical protein RND81_12G144200 [Saponaria officinalis]|uniref:Uncharacterized protein n=1 Tax=Saponaria officinalis TaxID=3572 RepID=A0AAW1HAM1_SAPOF
MMTSSGLGPYRVGGLGSLSSSSNLSPLAAPFRVDKSPHKQNSTNTSVSYPDMPMYGPYFDPGGQLWNHSSSSATGSNFAETESMRIDATCSSSPAVYEYSVSQPSNAVAGVYHSASGSAAAYDPFSYAPFPDPMSTASNEGVKSYYPPYVCPLPQKDGCLSAGVSSGHGFDLFSNSSNTHLGSCGLNASDHLQGRPGDENNKLHWGGSFWSGVNGHEKWLENSQGFGSKESNQSDILSSKSRFSVDGINKSQPSIVVHTHSFGDESSSNNIPDGGNRSNVKQDGCFNIFGGAYGLGSLGINQQDSQSLSGCLRLPTSVSSLTPKESSHRQDQIVQSVANFRGSQKENGLSCGDNFSQNDFYVFGCTSTTSTYPITKTELPYGESSSFPEGTFSAIEPTPKVSIGANENSFSARYDSYLIEPHMPLGIKRHSKVVIRRPISSSKMPSSSFRQIRESLDNRIVGKVVSNEDHISPKMPHQLNLDGLGMEVNDEQAAYSVEKLSGGSDVNNPAEDSPCWKGASINRFSTIAGTNAMDSDVFAKKMDEWESLNTQVSQVKSCLQDTSKCRDLSSEKAQEGNLSEKPFVPEFTSKDNKERYNDIQQPFCFDLNAGASLQFGDEGFVSTKECHILNEPETVLLPGITLGAKQISRGKEIPSPRPMFVAAASEGSGKFQPVKANNSFEVPSSSENDDAISLPGDTAGLKHCQETGKISDTNVDVNMLLKAMTNLSEILRSYCFSKRTSVPEQHSVTIKRVIANLNSSMLMMAGDTSSTMPSSEVNSFKNDITDAQKVTGAASEALAAAIKLGDTAEGLLDSVSCKDGGNTDGDGDITEILHESFPVEEDMDQQKLLYKNLWLDAEASLCAMTAKARFLRVKAEMERPHDGAKDSEIPSSFKNYGNVLTVEQTTFCKDPSVPSNGQKTCAISGSDRSEEPEVNKCHIPNAEVVTMNPVESEVQNCSLSLRASKQGNTGNVSDGSGSTNRDNDAEASVMARYRILKSRIESSEDPSQENKESTEGHKDPQVFGDAMGIDNPILANYQILKCRVSQESLNNERDLSLGEDNYLPDRESSSPVYQILESAADHSDSLYEVSDSQNSQMLSNSVGVSEVGEASVMTRFRILQSRMNQSDTVDRGQLPASPVKVLEDGTDELGLFLGRALGPYPEFTEDDDEDEDIIQLGVPVHGQVYLNPYCNSNKLNSEILESWFDNKCSSSDWEHVSKEDLRKPN